MSYNNRGDWKAEDEVSVDPAIPRSNHPAPTKKKTAPHLGFLKCHIANFAFFPTETYMRVEIPAFLAVSEHFDAIFMLLEQH